MSKKITLFLFDNLPKGLRSVRIDQWSGKAICAPRASIKKIPFGEIEESSCLYFLVSQNEDNDLPNIYVGETDSFASRLSDHDYKKDWWQEMVVFYSTDKSLTKTGTRYLEKICLERLRKAGRSNLMNLSDRKENGGILEEDKSGLEEYFTNITTVLSVFGYDAFEQNNLSESTNQGIHLVCEGKGSKSNGILLEDGKLRVLKGSTATKDNAPNFENHNYRHLKDKLLEIGKLKEEGGYLIFTDDYEFNSSSAAAAVILARSASGPSEWKNEAGKKLKDLLIG